jgi:hypothetical protein
MREIFNFLNFGKEKKKIKTRTSRSFKVSKRY